MDSNIIIALIGFAGPFLGTVLGIVSGQKINELRLKNLETKQVEQDKHLGDTDKKVVNLQIAVTAVEERVDNHEKAIDEIKTEQGKLASFHMEKTDKKE